jgi:glycosyltransferase involved in cell wall biosynthesis
MLYRRPIEMIPNSVPTDVTPLERRPAGHPVIISVGDSSARKNLPTLIKAFSSVRKSVPDAELRLIGPGLGTNEPMATSTRNSEIAAGVTFVGQLTRSELALEYAAAWLLVHPSLEETFGIALVEAISAGVPVLGGNKSGGVPFVLNYGAAGWLCRVSDPKELAIEIMDKVETGPPKMPPGAIDYVDANFAPEIVADGYLDWYRNILQSG